MIDTITLRFYKPTTFFEKIVCFFGRMRYVHVDACMKAATPGMYMMTDSMPPHGVRVWITLEVPYADVYVNVPINPSVRQWIMGVINTPYGYWDSLQTSIRRWTGIKLGGNPRGMQCAEYLYRALRENGYADQLPEDNCPAPDQLLIVAYGVGGKSGT